MRNETLSSINRKSHELSLDRTEKLFTVIISISRHFIVIRAITGLGSDLIWYFVVQQGIFFPANLCLKSK
jgi:hypothetical protein